MASLTKFVLSQRQRRTRNSFTMPRTRSLSLPPEKGGDSSGSVSARPHSPIMDDLECTICNEEFSEERVRQPRTLHCGHTFCTECTKTFFSNPKRKAFEKASSCPICRTPFRTMDINKIPVSFTILNIVLEIKNQRMRKRNSLGQGTLQAIGYCSPHSSPKQFWCASCTEWVCGACVVLKHTKGKDCEIKTVEEMVTSKKSIHEENLEKAKTSHEKIVEAILSAIDVCETSKNLLRYDIESFKNKIKYASMELKNFDIIQQKMKLTCSSVNEEWSVYSSLSENVEKAEDFTQLENASEKFKTLPVNYLRKEFFVQFQSKTWTKNLLLECWLKHPTSNFYIEEVQKLMKRIYRVSIRWPAICIHAGTVEDLPLGAMVIRYNDVVVKSEVNFFFDLCFSSEKVFHIKINIFTSNDFFGKFTDFCIGKNGHSYKSKSFFGLETMENSGAKIIWVDTTENAKEDPSTDNTFTSPEEELTEEFSLSEETAESIDEVESPTSATDQCQELEDSSIQEETESDNDSATIYNSDPKPENEMRNNLRLDLTLPSDQEPESSNTSSTRSVDSSSVDENPKIVVQSISPLVVGTILACIDSKKGEFCSRFGILLNSSPIENMNYVKVGTIINGDFSFMTKNLTSDNINELCVKDCGIKIVMN